MAGEFVHPIERIEWIEESELRGNDWNPNYVASPELKLLEHSILRQGWIQPVLVSREGEGYEIIDGFHRSMLTRSSAAIREKFGSRVPCVVMQLTVAERKCLTVRINRAKGAHSAVRMAELVKSLVNDHGYSEDDVAREIGATKDEVRLLMQEGVFTALRIPEHQYSRAWYPALEKKGRGKRTANASAAASHEQE